VTPEAFAQSLIAEVRQLVDRRIREEQDRHKSALPELESRLTAFVDRATQVAVAGIDREALRGKDGLDGKDGKDGKDGIGKDGRDGKDGQNGKDGRDVSEAFMHEEIQRQLAELREQALEGIRSEALEVVQKSRIRFLGNWKAGQQYEPGNVVRWGGDAFYCERATSTQPDAHFNSGEGGDWVLMVKKGRDARGH
jgi:hypothetical protein